MRPTTDANALYTLRLQLRAFNAQGMYQATRPSAAAWEPCRPANRTHVGRMKRLCHFIVIAAQ
jgi:hypothetical protein